MVSSIKAYEKGILAIAFAALFILFTLHQIKADNDDITALNFFFTLYKNDTVELIELQPSVGVPDNSSSYGDYTLKIISGDQTVYESNFFMKYFYNQTSEGAIREDRESNDFYLSLPYYESGEIQIYHLGNLLYETNFNFSPVCGNGVCEEGETVENCPQDCQIKYDVCGNGICESAETPQNCPQDCAQYAQTSTNSQTTNTQTGTGNQFPFSTFLIAAAIIIVVLAVAAVVMIKLRERSG